MTNYLTTQGTVIASQIGKGKTISTASSGQSASLIDMYFPAITYEYEVNGVTYENNRFWDEEVKIAQEALIKPYVDERPVGATVTVYYNPANPQQSHLQQLPEVNFGRVRIWAIGLAFVLILIIGLVALLFMP